MLGFGLGGILMGRLADRFGIVVPVVTGAIALGLGYVAHGLSPRASGNSRWSHGLLIGLLGTSAVFGPLMADISHWFNRRRGIAVGICASGNYLAGTVWPPIIQHFVDTVGWRQTHIVHRAHLPRRACCRWRCSCAARRQRSPAPWQAPSATAPRRALDIAPGTLQVLLLIAGLSCCVAMSMPQVHLVAYCGDLGYGAGPRRRDALGHARHSAWSAACSRAGSRTASAAS